MIDGRFEFDDSFSLHVDKVPVKCAKKALLVKAGNKGILKIETSPEWPNYEEGSNSRVVLDWHTYRYELLTRQKRAIVGYFNSVYHFEVYAFEEMYNFNA